MNKNIIFNLSATFINIGFPIILIPLLTTNLGINDYGIYVTIIALLGLLTIVFELGLDMSSSFILNDQSDSVNHKLKSKKVSNLIFLKLVLSFFAFLPLYFYLDFKFDGRFGWEVYSFFFLFFNKQNGILNACNKYKQITAIELISKLLMLILILGFIDDLDLELLFRFQFYSLILTFILTFYILFGCFEINIRDICRHQIKNIFLVTKGFYLSRLSYNIYFQSSVFIASIFLSYDKVGIYAIANQIYKVATSIIGSVSKVIYTSIEKEKTKTIIKFIKLLSILWFFGLFIVVFFGSSILDIILPNLAIDYFYPAVLIFYITVLFNLISSMMGYPLQSSSDGDITKAHLGVLAGSIFYFPILMLLIQINGISIISFVLAIFITEVFTSIIRMKYGYHLIKKALFDDNLGKEEI